VGGDGGEKGGRGKWGGEIVIRMGFEEKMRFR